MIAQYTSNWKRGESLPQKTSYVGNNMKSLYISVEQSLENLRTNYIDILYVHWVSAMRAKCVALTYTPGSGIGHVV